mmetsp:Transcript_81436/g.119294  ORF Transcript_81436/g.119294 Transcript_81436/m.119294 type:complete len:323 (-) Transcript_81436:432-1400(-)
MAHHARFGIFDARQHGQLTVHQRLFVGQNELTRGRMHRQDAHLEHLAWHQQLLWVFEFSVSIMARRDQATHAFRNSHQTALVCEFDHFDPQFGAILNVLIHHNVASENGGLHSERYQTVNPAEACHPARHLGSASLVVFFELVHLVVSNIGDVNPALEDSLGLFLFLILVILLVDLVAREPHHHANAWVNTHNEGVVEALAHFHFHIVVSWGATGNNVLAHGETHRLGANVDIQNAPLHLGLFAKEGGRCRYRTVALDLGQSSACRQMRQINCAHVGGEKSQHQARLHDALYCRIHQHTWLQTVDSGILKLLGHRASKHCLV